MSYDDSWPENTLEDRREAVRKSIHPVTLDELRKFGETAFPLVTDPWCEKFNALLKGNAHCRFYRAKSLEGADIIYCKDAHTAMWFLKGSGMGFVQPRGLEIIGRIVDSL